jgi:thiazole/oxazole-forming peptide maturase SagD family component
MPLRIGVIGPPGLSLSGRKMLERQLSGTSLAFKDIDTFGASPEGIPNSLSRRLLQALEVCDALIIDLHPRFGLLKYDLAQRCRSQVKPALFVQSEAQFSWIVPQSVDREQPCYACFELRRLACRDNFPAYLLARLATDDGIQGPNRGKRVNHEIVKRLAGLITSPHAAVQSVPLWAKAWVIKHRSRSWEEHWFAKHIRCPVCMRGKTREVRSRRRGSLDIGRANLLSPLCGLISRTRSEEFASAYISVAHSSNPNLSTGPLRLEGFGCSTQLAEAEIVAIGEAMELYAAEVWVPEEKNASGRGEGVDVRAIPVEEFVGVGHGETGDPSPSRPDMDWIQVWSLTHEESRLVPFPAAVPGAREGPWSLLAPTNGTAAHTSLRKSIQSALAEVIERDAFLLTWICELPAECFAAEDHPDPRVRDVIRALVDLDIRIRLYRLPVAAVDHVFLCLATAEHWNGKGPRIAVGLGCHPVQATAARKAILEAVSTWRELSRRLSIQRVRLFATSTLRDVHNVHLPGHHALFYAVNEDLGAFRFLLEQHPSGGMSSTREESRDHLQLSRWVRQLSASGHEVLYCDVTPSEVAAAGWHVSRVMVPNLAPLTHGTDNLLMAFPRVRQAYIDEKGTAPPSDVLQERPHPLG